MTINLDSFLDQNGLSGSKLSHFGRKGMRWGVRHTKAQLAKTNAESSSSPDAIRAHETLTAIRSHRSVTAVSDADLNHLVNRLNLEKRFSEIDPSTFDKGHARLQKLLKVGETANSAIKFANSPAGNLLSDMLGFPTHGKHSRPIPGSKAEALQKAQKKAEKARKKLEKARQS